MKDPRRNFSVGSFMYIAGNETEAESEARAVKDYLKYHPEEDEAEVAAQLKRERKEDWRKDYSVYDFYVTGGNMMLDYNEEHALEDYLERHPDADKAKVSEELRDAIERAKKRP